MNIFSDIRVSIINVLNELVESGDLPDGLNFDAVTAEPPRDASHGCIASNAAMVVAKKAGKNPREIAQKIVSKLELNKLVKSIDIAGPGFINLHLHEQVWYNLAKHVLQQGDSYGNCDIGAGEKVNIEYVSANPTGPLHIGHARGAVVGDALALLLIKSGYDVTKEYYINDAGSQVDMLARSAHIRYREARGQDVAGVLEGMYPGEYLKIVGQSFAAKYKDKYLHSPEEDWLSIMRKFALEAMTELIKADLMELGIKHDVFSSEKAIVSNESVDHVIKYLCEKSPDIVYQGVLEPPKGKLPDDWEAREQTLFRSTNYGDDVDRPLRKSDGSRTYFASDIVYHHDKIKRGFNHMVIALGADHAGYTKRLKAAVKALSGGQAELNVLIYQLVNFQENGVAMKMSKRAGTYVTVKDVVDNVGKDALRFIMLTRKSDVMLDFDLAKVTEQSKDNPVFYVQYAHARINSVLRKAAEENIEIEGDIEFALLKNEYEIALLKSIAQWPRIVQSAAKSHEPHKIAFYLQELSSNFHTLWNIGKEDDRLRFVIENNTQITKARLALIKACAITIASALNVMGVEPVTKM